MTTQLISQTALRIQRDFKAPRERVFRALTNAAALGKWFAVAEGYTTPIAEVDLRIGGRYRLGMKPPDDGPLLIVGGVYQLIQPPEKLIFTWGWEAAGSDEPESLVTVELFDLGDDTQVVLTHEQFLTPEARDQHGDGWQGCFNRLALALEQEEV
jgi:uncharacterized protein YndB with AHSA1/START domain